MAYERLIATNRLNNMVIIETPDSVFVSDINSSREVKTIVTRLKEMGRKEYYKHKTVHHAWGSATVLEHGENYKVDRMIIYPGAECELDHNGGLKKHIVVIKGTVKIVTDEQTIFLKEGESTSVYDNDTMSTINMVRLENPESEPLSIIQTSMQS
jgi:mannose-6-phosphate isomerase-like protein (cupin superfamily)